MLLCALFCSCSKNSYGNTPTSPYYKDPVEGSLESESSSPHIPVSIEKEIIYEKDGISVSVSEIINDSFWGPEIIVEIKNETSTAIELECADSSVNGIMHALLFYAKADAGATISDSITIYRDDLDLTKTYGIQNIEFKLVIKNADNGTTLDTSDVITIKPTGAEDFDQKYDDSGVIMLDVDGLKIIAKKIKNTSSISGSKVYLYIENKNEQSMSIKCSDLMINTTSLDAYFDCQVLSGKVAISEIQILESDLKKHEILNITTLDLTLTFFNIETGEEISSIPLTAELSSFVG